MKAKGRRKRHPWRWIFIIIVVSAVVLAGYYFIKKTHDTENIIISQKATLKVKQTPLVKKEISLKKEDISTEKIKESKPQDVEDSCSQIENDVREFFRYLDKKNYIRQIEKDPDTYKRFKNIITRLSARPPVPAGEGMDDNLLSMNIFYFFRRLDVIDLRLILEIVRNEADMLEINLDLFYKWLTLGDRCPNREMIRPSPEVLYRYAGFFINTIGGRAYLFRRPTGIRLLVSYYSLLILHKADKGSENSYGIDTFPEVVRLAGEISTYPGFHFQNEYIYNLNNIQNYYLKKK